MPLRQCLLLHALPSLANGGAGGVFLSVVTMLSVFSIIVILAIRLFQASQLLKALPSLVKSAHIYMHTEIQGVPFIWLLKPFKYLSYTYLSLLR